MSRRLPRPADLLALALSDDGLGENQAVTRELLARPRPVRRPIVTAVESWIRLRGLAWFEIEGRRIAGVATAQRMATREAWQIDTLLTARPEPEADDVGIAGRLLRRVAEAAAAERVGHVLLRTPAAAAVSAALRAGFRHVSTERLWTGSGLRPAEGRGRSSVVVREVRAEDEGELFRLYSAQTPVDARRALGLTLAEWRALDGSRWLGRRGRHWVAESGGRLVAAVRVSAQGAQGQVDLLCEPSGAGEPEGGRALLWHAHDVTARCGRVVSLVPRSAVAVEGLLGEHGLMPGREVELLAIRTRRVVVEAARRGAGVVVAGGS